MAHHEVAATKRSPLTKTSDIIDHIESATKKIKFRGNTETFLPRPDLNFVTCNDTVKNVIAKDNVTGWLKPQEEEAFVQDVCRKGRKMFITCVVGDVPMQTLRALLNHGLNDDKFPFKEEDCPAQSDVRKFRKNFIENQAMFQAAFFNLDSHQSLDNDMPKPIDYDEGKVIGKGAFGEVAEISIPKSQRDFSSGANLRGHFAMKITLHKGTRELKFHRDMAQLYHCHVVKCLSSFTYSSKYYMIYEKADCNVEEFMERNRDPSRLPNMTADNIGQQLFGLADGLSFVHNEGRSDTYSSGSSLAVPGQEPQKTAYLHDIKPENLLMFVYDEPDMKTYWIRLSDFSCAKMVDLVASVSGQHRESWRTMSKSGTPIYRAPETSGTGGSSRPYDLWSLGCVYLELLVWYLDGYNALQEFREARTGLVCPHGIKDQGFYFTKDEGTPARYQVRPAVIDKMADMSGRCKGPLKVVADVVPKLLQIKPEDRLTANDLVERLRKIDLGAKPPIEIAGSSHEHTRGRSPSPRSSMSSDSEFDFSFIKVQHPTT